MIDNLFKLYESILSDKYANKTGNPIDLYPTTKDTMKKLRDPNNPQSSYKTRLFDNASRNQYMKQRDSDYNNYINKRYGPIARLSK